MAVVGLADSGVAEFVEHGQLQVANRPVLDDSSQRPPRGPQIALYPVQSELVLAMAELWEAGLDTSLAAALEAEQPFERRIDMIRPDWEAQMEATRDLVQRLAARGSASTDLPTVPLEFAESVATPSRSTSPPAPLPSSLPPPPPL